MRFDFWYGHKKADVAFISVSFSDLDGVYRGNIYDKTGAAIGDYNTRDSLQISAAFPFFRWD